MAVIVIASPKGGAGKSTTAVILGTELARAGAEVTFIDADPNRSLSLWASKAKMPPRTNLINEVGEKTIIKEIRDADGDGKIVVVDLEGVASRLVSRAISQADLVLTPMKPTTLDATIGVRAIQLVAEEEEVLGREIPHAIVLTATKAVRSKAHSGIEASLKKQNVDIIQPELMERSAFAALFEFGGDLRSMPPQGNQENAIQNATGFAEAVFKRLMS